MLAASYLIAGDNWLKNKTLEFPRKCQTSNTHEVNTIGNIKFVDEMLSDTCNLALDSNVCLRDLLENWYDSGRNQRANKDSCVAGWTFSGKQGCSHTRDKLEKDLFDLKNRVFPK